MERFRRTVQLALNALVLGVVLATLAVSFAVSWGVRWAQAEVASVREGEVSDWSLLRLNRVGAGTRPGHREANARQRWVAYECVSGDLIAAVVASEDASFTRHGGFDWRELQNALEEAWQAGRLTRGASGISQQLAKNLFLGPERSLLRKLREAALTLALESQLDKHRILEVYLNIVEWAPAVYGVQAAADHYFGVDAASLSPTQSAWLASRLPAPLAPFDVDAPTESQRRRADRAAAWAPTVAIPERQPNAARCPQGPPRERARRGQRRRFSAARRDLQRTHPSLTGYPRVPSALSWGLQHGRPPEVLRGLAQALRANVRQYQRSSGAAATGRDVEPATAIPLDLDAIDPPVGALSPTGALLEAVRLLASPNLSHEALYGAGEVGGLDGPLAHLAGLLERKAGRLQVALSDDDSIAQLYRGSEPTLCVLSHVVPASQERHYHHAMVVHPSRRRDALFVLDITKGAGLSYSKLATKRLHRYLDRYLPRVAEPSPLAGPGRLTCAPVAELSP